MILKTIDTGFFKLDGGAMFGVVPKTIWQRLSPADENNLCALTMRCLLVETVGNQGEPRLILVDTGMGNKQEAKFFNYYHPSPHPVEKPGDLTLIDSIRKAGYAETDITDVLLTHLHFDHVGGAVIQKNNQPQLTFPNATYWSQSQHWQWATHPNLREGASFLAENILPIQASGQLNFVDETELDLPNVSLLFVDGHTEKMTLPKLTLQTSSGQPKTVLFCADLIPSVHHVPVQYMMSYDVRPLLTMDEKTQILNQAADEGWILVFDHDPISEAVVVEHTPKGVRIREKGRLSDFL
jgi:glyoxylase-like metal-dependent hydrolase (beta-lactamase superfamily II)